ncbi:hypothetical protein PTTG_11843 [Puccinia triticina 1-1 BBBD Race 1]|uniref:Protein MON2 homolog n=2 Tax=Puccinia triticina TaxID=208348 RepID=A0A180GL90_PUCT1|nr:uncharacterized protein PtA15_6A164 [Puccinia triticina]OAV93395.1 hypothetical protein PTTG_11843 [Puccinia triticina 1-1 BBBD Race 1]WAQ85536.1 hypothetical protein PtA15_6A164 [Puccinia triticina]WAR55421.1 hypothetical protein PtB15_6B162 [Puccinia triticina]
MASSGNFALLASDFQALASETKRKHADIKEAADKALALIRTSPDQILTTLRNTGVPIPGPADDIFRPISMACATKNAKVVAIALGSLQRLIGMDAIPASKIPQIVNLLSIVLPLGVEIQLRILQTLPSLFTRCAQHLHGSLLADALLLCFRLQDSRIGVVSSTAAATLRQLVMVVFEGVAAEDKAVKCPPGSNSEPDPTRAETDFLVAIPPFESIHLSGETERTEARKVALRPSAKDAYLVFEDLCLLVNGDSPSFLKLQSLPKTFGLELIESVMTGHGNLFQQHPELIFVLRAQLCPLLIRALSEKPTFPLTLRLMRVAFLLLKQFSDDLLVEAEIFLSLIIKTISVDHSEGQAEPVPIWLRVLALEIFRGLCVDFDLLLKIYERYDMRRSDQTSGLFTSLMGTFNRLASEKPALLGINQDIATGSSSYHIGSSANPGVQGMIDGVVGIATQAAAPLVGAQQGGLSLATAAMKLQCIDQLDKAEAPVIPETYVYLLALQCICNVAEGFAGFTLVQHEEFRHSRPSNSSDDTPPPSFILPIDELKAGPTKERLKMTRSMADASWPALLASLNFFVSTNLDEGLFTETLSAMQSFTYVCGILDLTTPRDAFLLSFCKFAVPPAIVANLIMEGPSGTPTKASQSVLSVDSLGLGATNSPTYFSPRSLSFLRTLLSVAQYLSGVLGSSWYTVFETLQNADYVIAAKLKKRTTQPSSQTSINTSGTTDESVIQANIQKLFDCSRNLDSSAFTSFVTALCRLSSETVGLPPEHGGAVTITPKTLTFDMRRKASGVPNLRNYRQNERSFAVAKLGSVALLNIRRLVLSDSEIAWTPITSHLLAVQRYPEAPSNIRLQAADVFDRMILSVPKLLNNLDETQQYRIQTQIIEVLGRQAAPDPSTQSSTDLEVRKLGFETLFKILENNGHSFVAGWKLILDVLRTACETSATQAPSDSVTTIKPLNYNLGSKGKGTSKPSNLPSKLSILVRNSFPSLQLICTDFLTALKLEELRQCISVLADFARQTEDINIALTSGGLLWQVSDHVQGKNKASKAGGEDYVRLWMYLLSKLLELVHASRQEVRDGAIQTLFRTIGLYGSSLSSTIWHELLWEVIYPLLDLLSDQIKKTPTQPSGASDDNVPIDVARQPNGAPISLNAKQLDDSKILALESTGKVVSDHFASHILVMPQFSKTWANLIQHLSKSFTSDRPSVSTASMKTLATILNTNISGDQHVKEIAAAWEVVWSAFVQMSERIAAAPSESKPDSIYFTQAALEAYIQVLRPLQNTSRLTMSHARIQSLLEICKIVITYSESPDFRPDIDTLPPVPAAVIATIDRIDHNAPDVSSAVLSSTAELGTLAFVSPFETTDTFSNRPSTISVTYIALFKAIQPRLVSLVEKFCKKPDVYNTGALTKVLSSFSTPLRLKYGCPAPSKHGKAPPLWKTASISFLTIVKSCLPSLNDLGRSVTQDAFESFWKQVVENFSCVLSADCKPELLLDLDQQQAEENFDLAFVASLELDILPYLGHSRIPDDIIRGLGMAVQRASRLYTFDLEIENSRQLTITSQRGPSLAQISAENCRFIDDFAKQAKGNIWATTADVSRRPRERFIYWCFDLLFLFCSPATSSESQHKRVASIWLPILLTRCIATIRAYLADAPIRGTVPFNRLRDEEITYILRQLLTHSLSDGCAGLSLCGEYSPTSPSGQPLLCLQPILIDLLACENSGQSGVMKHVYSCPQTNGSSLTAYFTYRDLLQISSPDGADTEGCWRDLKLGRIGRSVQLSDDYGDIFGKDLKELVILCLRKITQHMS